MVHVLHIYIHIHGGSHIHLHTLVQIDLATQTHHRMRESTQVVSHPERTKSQHGNNTVHPSCRRLSIFTCRANASTTYHRREHAQISD